MKNLPMIGLCLMLSALAPLPVWAQQGSLPLRTSGFYAGIGAGYSQADLKNGPVEVSGGDVSYKILAGYRFPKAFLPFDMNAAIEGAYVDLGESDDQSIGSELKLGINGFDLYAVGFLPITRRWDLFGKVGLFFWDADLTIDGATSDDDSGSDLAFGLGLAYQTDGPLGAQVEINAYDMLDGVWAAFVSGTYQFK